MIKMKKKRCKDCDIIYHTYMKYSKYCKLCRTYRSSRWKHYDDTRKEGYRVIKSDLNELKGGN